MTIWPFSWSRYAFPSLRVQRCPIYALSHRHEVPISEEELLRRLRTKYKFVTDPIPREKFPSTLNDTDAPRELLLSYYRLIPFSDASHLFFQGGVYLQSENDAPSLHAEISNSSSIPSRPKEASLSSDGDYTTEIWSIDRLLDRLITGDGE
jgi:hypothetical protein